MVPSHDRMLLVCIYRYVYRMSSVSCNRPGLSHKALLRRLGPLRRVLCQLLATHDARLDADAAEHQADAQPLHAGEAVAKGHDGQHHGEHLARHRHRHEENRGEGREGVD